MTFAARIRYWLPLLPLLVLLGATYWLNQQVQPESFTPDGHTRHDPDSIVENFSATKLSEQGTPHFVLSARRMLHYPDDDSTALDVPRLYVFGEDRPPLLAIAETGVLTSKGDELILQGGVEVLRGTDAQQDPLTLLTEYLLVIPDQEMASSDQAVTLVEAHATVNAIGMELDNRARTIKLLSMVKGEYGSPEK